MMSSEKTTTKNNFFAYFKIDFRTIQGNVTLSFLVTITFAALLLLYTNYSWQIVSAGKEETINVVEPINFYSITLLNQVKQSQINLNQYLLLNDSQYKLANRKLWLVTIPNYKDSLQSYITLTNNEDARVSYIDIGKKLAELKQLQEQAELTYITTRNRSFLRKILQDDLVFTLNSLEKEILHLVDIEQSRKEELEEGFETNLRNSQYVIILMALIGFVLPYSLGSYLISKNLLILRNIRKTIKSLSKGVLPEELPIRKDEFSSITYEVNHLIENLKSIKKYADQVGDGNFDHSILQVDKESSLGKSLNDMGDSLQKVYEEDKQQSWVTEGLAKFAEILRNSSDSIEHLSRDVINNLVKHLNIIQGGVFILRSDVKNEDPYFELKGAYAYGKEKFLNKKVYVYDGLLGRIYKEKELIYFTDVPDNYMSISSGLGSTEPKCLLILPLEYENNIVGAIELASFKEFRHHEIDFLKRLSDSTASTIAAATTSQKNKQLLMEAQQMTHTLKTQERELRQNALEMLSTQEEVKMKLKSTETEQKRVTAVLDNLLEALIVTNERGEILIFNKKSERTFGYTRDEMIGKNVKLIMPLGQSKEHDAHIINYVQTGVKKAMDQTREVNAIRKDGAKLKLLLSLSEAKIENERFFIALMQKL